MKRRLVLFAIFLLGAMLMSMGMALAQDNALIVATNIDDIITEIIATKTSERGETRIDDRVSEAAMEDRKKNGYF